MRRALRTASCDARIVRAREAFLGVATTAYRFSEVEWSVERVAPCGATSADC